MKAIVLEGAHQPLQYKDVRVPEISAGEALVKITAAAFNRRDWWIRQGQYAGLKFPIIPGSDGAGVVEAIDESGSNQQWLGEHVVINPSLHWDHDAPAQPREFKILGLPDDGTFAEYVKVPIQNLYEKPAHLSFEEAGALPLGGLTAYRAVFTKGKLRQGEKVLIGGAGGGVATFALLWALNAGAEVYVTSGTPSKIGAAVKLGAKAGANYREESWTDQLKESAGGFDLIIDSALGDGFAQYTDLANPGGRIVFFGGTSGNIPPLEGRKIFWKQLSILGTTMGSADDFSAMLAFVNKHRIKPVIDSVYPIAAAETALQKMGDSAQFGKIVLQLP